ncbi:peptidoglycan bridge formation glycyltransferase FemA/FemB family protein [Arthrobacter agilis]|uniref:lipid II:glycine glycyltransferase FemX n=1 Tax=Arthrobacter agilis TaxID=37921 RepID=UPI000B35C5BC|nr:peptidoglycan bridge formation glycyltransferase FemA/FemB family protein [Arthrobacter agilis]PPB45363.1 peptidoglycan bridge formation glycyltransferase FemA/FemB family protein [Arthrobacter agilis]TPV28072.1 peptidoglycan bridge formation glycyltransferase FemA/FemB family protein [Arthrobacter agilis]VDR31226.1 Lipid II:glycine glycyltransferase [Arthrobacter agilis]
MAHFSARFATGTEQQNWDSLVTGNPGGGNMLQSRAFAEVKSHHGWRPRFVVLEGPDYTSHALVLEKKVPVVGALWYLIKGPAVTDPGHVPAAAQAVAELARRERHNVFAIKVEPDLVDTPELRETFRVAGLVKTFNLQPNDSTALLDTTPESNQLLRTLHSRGRNAVRRAIREGVEVQRMEPTEDTFRAMYALMSHIEDRSAARMRSFEYYSRFWQNFVDAGQGRFYFVHEDGQPSVGAFVVNYGSKGTYKDGGSRPGRSQYGDSHLVQWTAINDLKDEFGIVEYDFCGTPPSDRLKDTDHPHHGLGLFKTSFTKTVTDYAGCFDLVVSGWKYRVWNTIAERVARQIHWRRTHQPFY